MGCLASFIGCYSRMLILPMASRSLRFIDMIGPNILRLSQLIGGFFSGSVGLAKPKSRTLTRRPPPVADFAVTDYFWSMMPR